jgi:aspartate aminotransferase
MPASTQYELRLAGRMARLGTETAFEVLNKAKALEAQGKSIIHLEIGEPDFDTPSNVVEAAVDALHKGWTHYGPSAGLPALRQTIADYISRTRGITVTPDEVVVVPGGKPIMFYAILALIDEGDEVIYPNPGFPIYESMINYMGGKAVPIQLREERDFTLDVNELPALITDRTKLIILNSPQNPTGGVMPRKDIEQVAKIIGDRNILVLSDEIYSRLLFEGEHFLHRGRARHEGAHHHSRWLLQDLRHDRLAHGLRRHARGSRHAHHSPDDQLQLLHRQLHAGRRHRGAYRRSERRRAYVRRI